MKFRGGYLQQGRQIEPRGGVPNYDNDDDDDDFVIFNQHLIVSWKRCEIRP